MSSWIFTIGYQDRTPDGMFEVLQAAGVQVLMDVRYRAQSRKRGFSKSSLASLAGRCKIGYMHDRRLGTPPVMMKEKRATGRYDLEGYRAYLRERELVALKELAVMSTEAATCLLCYEADVTICHRLVVAEEAARLASLSISHI